MTRLLTLFLALTVLMFSIETHAATSWATWWGVNSADAQSGRYNLGTTNFTAGLGITITPIDPYHLLITATGTNIASATNAINAINWLGSNLLFSQDIVTSNGVVSYANQMAANCTNNDIRLSNNATNWGFVIGANATNNDTVVSNGAVAYVNNFVLINTNKVYVDWTNVNAAAISYPPAHFIVHQMWSYDPTKGTYTNGSTSTTLGANVNLFLTNDTTYGWAIKARKIAGNPYVLFTNVNMLGPLLSTYPNAIGTINCQGYATVNFVTETNSSLSAASFVEGGIPVNKLDPSVLAFLVLNTFTFLQTNLTVTYFSAPLTFSNSVTMVGQQTNLALVPGGFVFADANGKLGVDTPGGGLGSSAAWGFMSISNAVGSHFTLPSNNTYETITNWNYSVSTNVVADIVAGTLTNTYAGWYRISFSVSATPGVNDQIEADVTLNGVNMDAIAAHTTAPTGGSKDMNMAGEGILNLPANTQVSLKIKNINTTTLTITHSQLAIGVP